VRTRIDPEQPVTTAALQDMFYPGNRCFGCGGANPHGLHLKSYETGDGLVAEWTPEERYQGPPGVVNGGVMAIPMDCHSTWAAMHRFSELAGGEPVGAVTASYSVRLRRPTPIGQRMLLHAEVTDVAEGRATVRTTATVDGEVTAIFEGTFVAVDLWDSDQG
jgi:acyl-coenzyme A thioesterase PaaI-like protein